MHLFDKYDYDTEIKLQNFPKYASRQSITRFLARYELFKIIRPLKGSIVECGVHYGGGIMSWAKLCAGLDVFDLHRKIIGFDTFDGFPSLDDKDMESKGHSELKKGGFSTQIDIYPELKEAIEEFDKNRFLNQFWKVQLVKGDACETIPQYVKENQHLLISLLVLDFDIYEPTKVALEQFLPRMCKGSIILFDEINNENWAGETTAMLEQMNINNYEIKKFDFDPNIAYLQL